MTTSVELLHFAPQSMRTAWLFEALARTSARAGLALTETTTYHGTGDWLLLWGAGAPDRFAPMAYQLEHGGHVITCDLAYWDRYNKFRVSIDGPHPQHWVMRQNWPDTRLKADRITCDDAWDPKGPVIVAGLGRKARVQYGAERIDAWERRMMATAQQRGHTVLYRRKQDDAPLPKGARQAPAGVIERVLDGAGLVITWHSNVAIDAIRMGIPVICQDGAAAAVYQSTFPADGDPSPLPVAVRDQFLANLAWYQWAPTEAPQMWAFLREVLA